MSENEGKMYKEKLKEIYTGREVTTSLLYDERAYKYFNAYNIIARKKVPRWNFFVGIMGIFFICFVVLYLYMLYQFPHSAGSSGNSFKNQAEKILVSLIALSFGIYALIRGFRGDSRVEFIIDQRVRQYFQSHKPFRQIIKIQEDKIFLIQGNQNDKVYTFDWLNIGRIDKVDAFFFLYSKMKHRLSAPIMISKDPAMIVKGDYETLLAIINEKIKTRPYHHYTKKFMRHPIPYVKKANETNVVSTNEVKIPDTKDEDLESNHKNRDDKPQE